MKAFHFYRYGSPDVLRLEDEPVPTPTPGAIRYQETMRARGKVILEMVSAV